MYVTVGLFDQKRNTKVLPAVFPARFQDTLKFDKVITVCKLAYDVVIIISSSIFISIVKVSL